MQDCETRSLGLFQRMLSRLNNTRKKKECLYVFIKYRVGIWLERIQVDQVSGVQARTCTALGD